MGFLGLQITVDTRANKSAKTWPIDDEAHYHFNDFVNKLLGEKKTHRQCILKNDILERGIMEHIVLKMTMVAAGYFLLIGIMACRKTFLAEKWMKWT